MICVDILVCLGEVDGVRYANGGYGGGGDTDVVAGVGDVDRQVGRQV